MNSVGTPNGTTLPRRGRVREFVASNPDLVSVCLYALVAAAMVVAADLAIFTVFQPYDDEGTLLVTLNAFTHGAPLYKDVYTEYGPFYYELFGGLFRPIGPRGNYRCEPHDRDRDLGVDRACSSASRRSGSVEALCWACTGAMAAFAALRVLAERADAPARPVLLC